MCFVVPQPQPQPQPKPKPQPKSKSKSTPTPTPTSNGVKFGQRCNGVKANGTTCRLWGGDVSSETGRCKHHADVTLWHPFGLQVPPDRSGDNVDLVSFVTYLAGSK